MTEANYFDHDGAQIWYTVSGEGPAVVLIHGWTCDSHDWVFQIPFLISRGFQVIAMDLRGHGKSSAPQSSYSFPEFRNDIVGLLNHLSVSSAIVIGHSLGTKIACELAIYNPGLVRAIVLVEQFYDRPKPDSSEVKKMFSGNPQAAAVGFFEATCYTESSPAWLKCWHQRRALAMPANVVFDSLIYSIESWACAEEAADFLKARTVPKLVLCDEPKIAFEKTLSTVDGDKIVGFNAGHWPQVEEPEKLNAILGEWLDTLPRN